MKLFVLFFCAVLLTIVNNVKCLKVLIAVPMPAHSHFTIAFRLAEELISKGHEVTSINPYPRKQPLKNYRDVPVVELFDYIAEVKKILLDLDKIGPIGNHLAAYDLGLGLTERALAHKNVQKLLNSKEMFDVIIIEHFLCESFVGLGQHFNAPVIMLSSTGSDQSNYMVSNPAPSSYVPNLITSLTNPMSFFERLHNFGINVIFDILHHMYFIPEQRKLFKKHFKTELDDALYNVSLILANSHSSLQDATPKVPNIIEIGGYHLYPTKELPKDIKDFLDKATEGVVLFSMGSNLQSKNLSPEIRSGILKAFSKIKQKVLWKFETDLPEAPPNVKVMSWLPQQDILAHPNVKAFISHGGLLGTTEAVYFGVPIIGIPVFGDQKSNIANAVSKEYAVSVPLKELCEEKLSAALDQVLNNPKYRKNAQVRSKIMRDRPLSPADTAVYWVEYVVRHKGAPHLRSAAVNLTWYQIHMIDIIVALTLATILVFTIFYLIIKKILGLIFNQKIASKSKKNN